MSIEIPENMEEVAMRQAQLKVRGQEKSADDIIAQALLDTLQILIDQELDGHYDTVAFEAPDLVITDLMHEEVARLAPEKERLIDDFKDNAEQLFDRLETTARKAAGSR
ncbi:hypothetical protein [Paucilactobacillus sp. N302-9]